MYSKKLSQIHFWGWQQIILSALISLLLGWRGRMRRAVPVMATCLALLFIVRGLSWGIPYLSPQLNGPTKITNRSSIQQPATVHYCHGPAAVAEIKSTPSSK